jgi:glycine dehydrogenase
MTDLRPRGVSFQDRHIGPSQKEIHEMLSYLGHKHLDEFSDTVVPASIRIKGELDLPAPLSEHDALKEIRGLAAKNERWRSMIGQGYYESLLPPVIQRTILENPGWYTQYTPYQAEIAQGRLEALFNFQSAVSELTGLPISNASLLDEGTAAAEGVAMAFAAKTTDATAVIIDEECFFQTQAVVVTRCQALGIETRIEKITKDSDFSKAFVAVIQNPGRRGHIRSLDDIISKLHDKGAFAVVCCDPLSLALYRSPGEMGADIAVGSFQRFGLPMGNGGPHAAFMSCKNDFMRRMPGRIVGLSKDRQGKPAYRLALQTREQHIRREKATSNICTSQVLLAVMSSMYCLYHGSEGLRYIAQKTHYYAKSFANSASKCFKLHSESFFDTVTVLISGSEQNEIRSRAEKHRINLQYGPDHISISFDETSTDEEVKKLTEIFGLEHQNSVKHDPIYELLRQGPCLRSEIFDRHRSETDMLRYIKSLEQKDLSLTHSMIPLGSCTMKLNAAAELYPVSFENFANIHPFAPENQLKGYQMLTESLSAWLASITGLPGISLQPNSGAQGEYAGLLAIKNYLLKNGGNDRDICLIPRSAHGTNPASASMCGFKVVPIDCDDKGNIKIDDLKAKISKVSANLACIMVTYPSTHGVFEKTIQEICDAIHAAGGLVYMDGANMNAQVGLCRPGDYGIDVCHLNLHKTFCIPHGGGGPGVGPIAATEKLIPFLPSHPHEYATNPTGPVAAAPFGSASILPIPWMYIRMMGSQGLKQASQVAILNANYISKRLSSYFPILYTDANGFVAHECIVDLRAIRSSAGVEVEDIAKRLMDYGFHAPTISWPVPHTMMIEPTESESKKELDRFCEAMIAIHGEIEEIKKTGQKDNNVLKNAPHTAAQIASSDWNNSYSREQAVFPLEWVQMHKFWPSVARVDNAYGDRNLVCTCEGMESYS